MLLHLSTFLVLALFNTFDHSLLFSWFPWHHTFIVFYIFQSVCSQFFSLFCWLLFYPHSKCWCFPELSSVSSFALSSLSDLIHSWHLKYHLYVDEPEINLFRQCFLWTIRTVSLTGYLVTPIGNLKEISNLTSAIELLFSNSTIPNLFLFRVPHLNKWCYQPLCLLKYKSLIPSPFQCPIFNLSLRPIIFLLPNVCPIDPLLLHCLHPNLNHHLLSPDLLQWSPTGLLALMLCKAAN